MIDDYGLNKIVYHIFCSFIYCTIWLLTYNSVGTFWHLKKSNRLTNWDNLQMASLFILFFI